jgi:hypothetical protein
VKINEVELMGKVKIILEKKKIKIDGLKIKGK